MLGDLAVRPLAAVTFHFRISLTHGRCLALCVVPSAAERPCFDDQPGNDREEVARTSGSTPPSVGALLLSCAGRRHRRVAQQKDLASTIGLPRSRGWRRVCRDARASPMPASPMLSCGSHTALIRRGHFRPYDQSTHDAIQCHFDPGLAPKVIRPTRP